MAVSKVYVDLAKAFDKVDHRVLLAKLVEFGFSRNVYLFMKSYLSCRLHIIRVGGSFSQAFMTISDIPQGSNLGPLLFLMFINDLPNSVKHSDGLLFPNDFKIFKKSTNSNDCSALQADLNLVTEWFQLKKRF